jgi:hypothetical protein
MQEECITSAKTGFFNWFYIWDQFTHIEYLRQMEGKKV